LFKYYTKETNSDITSFSNSDCSISYIIPESYAYVTEAVGGTGEIQVTNVTSSVTSTQGLKIIGGDSEASAVCNNFFINTEAANNFNTFTQLTRFEGSLTSGSFSLDDTVYQQNANTFNRPTAFYHSGNSTTLYVSGVQNEFSKLGTSNTGIVQNDSGAQFVLSAQYPGEIVRESGDILYIENLDATTRSNTQTETIKIIFKF